MSLVTVFSTTRYNWSYKKAQTKYLQSRVHLSFLVFLYSFMYSFSSHVFLRHTIVIFFLYSLSLCLFSSDILQYQFLQFYLFFCFFLFFRYLSILPKLLEPFFAALIMLFRLFSISYFVLIFSFFFFLFAFACSQFLVYYFPALC